MQSSYLNQLFPSPRNENNRTAHTAHEGNTAASSCRSAWAAGVKTATAAANNKSSLMLACVAVAMVDLE